MGSDSDLPLMSGAAEVLEKLGIASEVTIISAHRTPERMFEYAQTAHERGIKVIIAGAGGAVHLPGMVAALAPLPVIGVPRALKNLDGLDSLLSIVQMPPGIPVATISIDGAKNAGLLAARILAVNDETLWQSLVEYQSNLKNEVLKKAKKLESIGYESYLEEQQ